MGGSRTSVRLSFFSCYQFPAFTTWVIGSASSVAAVFWRCQCYHIPSVFPTLFLFRILWPDDCSQSHVCYARLLLYFVFIRNWHLAVSCFDERLLEDPSVNRLEDSFLLWRAVCSSKLLPRITMILFLNKCDLLKRKLKTGAMVSARVLFVIGVMISRYNRTR